MCGRYLLPRHMDNIQLCIPGILTCTPRVLTCIPGVPYLKTWYTLPAHPEYLPAHLDFLPGYLKYFTSTPAALCLYGVWSVHLHTQSNYQHTWTSYLKPEILHQLTCGTLPVRLECIPAHLERLPAHLASYLHTW